MLDDGVLDKETTVLAIFPSPMMYAGPTEVSIYNTTAMAMYVYVRQQACVRVVVPCICMLYSLGNGLCFHNILLDIPKR